MTTASFAEINGYRLRYRLEGEGPLAVFGHGLLGSMEQVDDNMSRLDELHRRLRLLVYDARGHGQSSGPEGAEHYTWESLGRDMVGLCDHAGESTAFFGGASMGAASALWVALERPERVRALVLVMPPPLGPESIRAESERSALRFFDMLSAAVANFGVEKTVEIALQIPGFAASPEEAEERAAWLRRQNPLALVYGVIGLMRSPIHDPGEYARITVPTLVLAHEGDALHPARAARLVGEKVPHARVVIAPNPNHWWKHPDEFMAEVTTFVDGVEGARNGASPQAT